MAVISEIKRGASERKLVNIFYKDSKGAITSRDTEPYEIKGDTYFGYDVNKGSIRAFKVDSIINAKALDISFNPRFEIKI